MRLLPTALLPALLAACASAPRPVGEGGDPALSIEQAVLAVEDEWLGALVRRDAATMERLLASEFVLSGSAPALETRAQYLKDARMPERTLEPIMLEGREVQVYGGTVLTLGTAHLRGRWREHKIDRRYRYTNIYVQREGHWRAVASQWTAVTD